MRIASLAPVSLVSSRMKPAPAIDTATNWTVDPEHSHVGFKIRHMMVSNTNGRFRKVRGRVVLDDHHLENSQVQAVIEAASIDTDLPKRDDHLRSNEFFDVENYPHLSFASKRVEPAGPKQLMVVGDLRIKGITKEVTFKVEYPGTEVKDPWGNLRRGAIAVARVHRKDFGLDWTMALENGGVVLGNQVLIQMNLELIRATGPLAPFEVPAS